MREKINGHNEQEGGLLDRSTALFVVLLAFGVLCLFLAVWFSRAIVDDAFFYSRVAGNLLRLGEWSYNPGEPFNPITGPFYLLVLTAFMAVGLPVEVALLVAFYLGLFVAMSTLFLALRKEFPVLSLLLPLVLVSNPTLLEATGMETSWFIALLFLSASAYQKERSLLLGVLLSFLALTRPDGALLYPLVILCDLVFKRRFDLQVVVGGLFIAIPWTVFAYGYFGDVLPHSVYVKAAASQVGWWAEQEPFWWYFLFASFFYWLTLSLAALGSIPLVQQVRKGHYFLALIITFGLTLMVSYSLTDAPVGYRWYLAPGFLSVNFLIALFFWFITGRVVKKGGIASTVSRAVGLAAMVFFVGAEIPRDPERVYRYSEEYRAISEWIVENTSLDSKVSAVEIGYIGALTGRYIVDPHGLIHKEALSEIKEGKADWWYYQYQPQVVITSVEQLAGKVSSEWTKEGLRDFLESYREKVRFGKLVVMVRLSGR